MPPHSQPKRSYIPNLYEDYGSSYLLIMSIVIIQYEIMNPPHPHRFLRKVVLIEQLMV